MEETKPMLIHSLSVKERKYVSIEGVKKLDSFDKEEFLIETTQGYLHILGHDLTLGGMDMEKGHLTIEGTVDAFRYLHEDGKQKKEGFLKRLFK